MAVVASTSDLVNSRVFILMNQADHAESGIRNFLVSMVRLAFSPVNVAAIFLVLAYYLLAVCVLGVERVRLQLYSEKIGILLYITTSVVGTGYLLYVMLFIRPRRLLAYLAKDIATRGRLIERLVVSCPLVLLLPVFMGIFSSWKYAIPILHPFAYDVLFSNWDQWLHLGRLPWQWLQPVLGHPLISFIINFFYHLWFFIMFGCFFWFTFSLRKTALRTQYLISFFLTWIIVGNLLATLMSAAGPVYFGRVTGLTDVYRPLMDYLYEASEHYPIWALSMQEMLWEFHQGNDIQVGVGISAMPSMHVSSTMVMWLAMRQISIWAGRVFFGFLMLILIGSVHLGWHYAVDGYVALIVTLAIWWLAGWIARRMQGDGEKKAEVGSGFRDNLQR